MRQKIYYIVALLAVMLLLWYVFIARSNTAPLQTATAEIGTVTAFMSVSGTATVDDIIPLSFPKGGTVSGIFVERGEEVATGTVLATIGDTSLQAEYAAALADVTRARALRDELLNGQTTEEAAVTDMTLAIAENALTNTIRTEAARVEAARATLLNAGLTAIAENADLNTVPPIITGSYTCTAEGTYRIELYRSGTVSGYSYRYSGIETGTGNASTNQSSPIGSCGLRLQFNGNANYNNAIFTISIPNTASPTYANNRALYEQARIQESANIEAAKRARDLAQDQTTLTTAGARVERLVAANAVLAAAEARLSQVAYLLSESAIRALSSGVITDVSIATGQTVGSNPVITLFTPHKTTVVARIPEKDIVRASTGQTVLMTFDAKPAEELEGSIVFLSPLQSIVNGTPYYEALISVTETPLWLRSGMQADIKIITKQLTDVVRIPRLYVTDEAVTVRTGDAVSTIEPNILLIGSDGFVAVDNIAVGTELMLSNN